MKRLIMLTLVCLQFASVARADVVSTANDDKDRIRITQQSDRTYKFEYCVNRIGCRILGQRTYGVDELAREHIVQGRAAKGKFAAAALVAVVGAISAGGLAFAFLTVESSASPVLLATWAAAAGGSIPVDMTVLNPFKNARMSKALGQRAQNSEVSVRVSVRQLAAELDAKLKALN